MENEHKNMVSDKRTKGKKVCITETRESHERLPQHQMGVDCDLGQVLLQVVQIYNTEYYIIYNAEYIIQKP